MGPVRNGYFAVMPFYCDMIARTPEQEAISLKIDQAQANAARVAKELDETHLLRDRLKACQEALKFYADPKSYVEWPVGSSLVSPIESDEGKRAQEALRGLA